MQVIWVEYVSGFALCTLLSESTCGATNCALAIPYSNCGTNLGISRSTNAKEQETQVYTCIGGGDSRCVLQAI